MNLIKLDQYKVDKIHYWSTFTSSTKDKNFAIHCARGVTPQDITKNIMIFEIYVSGQNSPATNIDLPNSYSFYPSQQEVLLLPFFCFQVISVKNYPKEGITFIKIVEIPH